MRTRVFLPAWLLTSLVAASSGCKWTDFDDLADKTWVRATEKPNVGSTQYALGIVGATTPGAPGGQLSVLSNDVPSYSTLDYSQTGDVAVGPNTQKLGLHFIASLSDPPIFIGDGNGKVAIVERAIDAGNIAVVLGTANAVSDAPFASTTPPDAAAFVNGNVVVAAGPAFYTVTGMGAPTQCTSTDAMLRVAALDGDNANLWVWTQAGVLGSVPVSALVPCTGGMLPAFGTTFTTTGFMPGPGSQLHRIGNYMILAGRSSTGMGLVTVVDTQTMQQVGTPLMVPGLESSVLSPAGNEQALALGIPSRSVDGVMAGQVEIHAVDAATGTIGSVLETLNDAQPDGGQEFGRALTTMLFNNQEILVVGGHSEIFAYYKTSLYDALPPQ
jgi:hypothetical protein